MEIIKGKIQSAQKVLIYGPEGIGKSTLAARFPDPLFIDTEGSTKHMDVSRLPKPSSWTMLLEQVRYVRDHPVCGTLVIDTADWAERLCLEQICAVKQIDGIESMGYGRGYVYLAEEFGRLLNLLDEVIGRGINVCFTAHAKMRKIEQPDEMGAYDHWEVKLQKNTAPLIKEWADLMLFANYKTYVVNVDGQGTQKGKNKGQDGGRVLYAAHHPCWDAKNRHGLPDELPMDYAAFAHCIPAKSLPETTQADPPAAPRPAASQPAPEPSRQPDAPPTIDPPRQEAKGIPKPLQDLMEEHAVTEPEIQEAVASRGYYPRGMPITDYDPDFIAGVLVGAWAQVHQMIVASREKRLETPF